MLRAINFFQNPKQAGLGLDGIGLHVPIVLKAFCEVNARTRPLPRLSANPNKVVSSKRGVDM